MRMEQHRVADADRAQVALHPTVVFVQVGEDLAHGVRVGTEHVSGPVVHVG